MRRTPALLVFCALLCACSGSGDWRADAIASAEGKIRGLVADPGATFSHVQLTGDSSTGQTCGVIMAKIGAFTKQGSGTLTITGTKNFSGTTTVNAGTLKVDGTMASSTFQVNSGGTLTGGGAVGATTVANGGTLAGKAGQTLTLASLTLNDGSNVSAALGAANTTPLFDVTGNLTLDGKLSVSDAGGFGNGTYRIANYGGTLTNNGLVIGYGDTDAARIPGLIKRLAAIVASQAA